jgi:Uma2 family endonuclease
MTWTDVLADPCLQNLPYKIELNELGQILMSPATNFHGLYQGEIADILRSMQVRGKIMPECSIDTTLGVKVADLAWMSGEFFKQYAKETPFPVAPELCVEIVSRSNSKKEMVTKIDLYLAKGAKEVWLCTLKGKMSFFNHSGQIPNSNLFPEFPHFVDLNAENM